MPVRFDACSAARNWPWFLKPVAASFIVMPAGSIFLTFAESCGLDWIFDAIGDTGVVVPPVVVPPVVVPPVVVPPVVVPPVVVPPVVEPLVVPLVLPLVVPVVVVAVRLPDLCDEPLVFALPAVVVLVEDVVFGPWLLVVCADVFVVCADAFVVWVGAFVVS